MTGSMSEDGVKKGSYGPYSRCWQCGHAYPIVDMKKYKGRYYCIKQGCYTDIKDLVRKGR